MRHPLFDRTTMNTRLKEIQNWVDLANQANWSASAVAAECNVSLRTLQRYFNYKMGKSPKAWLFEQRQKRAAELLLKGITVKQVANHLGYQHSTQLSREFKKYWGHAPTIRKAGLELR